MPYVDPEKRRECQRRKNRKRRANGKAKAYNKRWRKEHPEEWKAEQRKIDLKRKGWTPSMVEQTSTEQGGRCMICRQEPTGNGTCGGPAILHADHNHTTGEPRALLCGNCNKALGLLRDNPELCRAAAEYLEDWA